MGKIKIKNSLLNEIEQTLISFATRNDGTIDTKESLVFKSKTLKNKNIVIKFE